ncbi:MAG: GNAT family N-acetyltransferase [Clostridium sp.]|nr:GNAT family N-acetyltransferase [Clostridium sp.]
MDSLECAFVAYRDSEPVGCVAWKGWTADEAELKRMFIVPACRGQGIAKALVAAVEADVAAKGYTALMLETGKHLTSALSLYHTLGFMPIPNYGPYVDFPNSVCLRKALCPPSAT